MNKLSFETSEYDWLSFVLLVDGRALLAGLHADDHEIPYWICDMGIPTLPPNDSTAKRIIVGVCGCGEYGCGHTSAKVERSDGIVRLFEFERGSRFINEFQFDANEFDLVSNQIARIANDEINKNDKSR
jgi:hypothetical protein